MSDVDIAASLYGAPRTDTAVADKVDLEPVPVPVAAEPAHTAGVHTPDTDAVPADPEGSPAEVRSSVSGLTDPRVAAKMVENRVRYLRWLCGALVVCAAVALIVPSAPWYHFAAESQTVMVEVPGGGFEYFETDAADMTRSGRAEGASRPAAVLAGAAVLVAFLATRRWWFAIPVVAVVAFGSGRAHPPASDLATTQAGFEVPNSSLATPEWGLDVALGVYWVTFAAIVAAGAAALIVRHSEHRLTRATTGDPSVGGAREILSRHVVGGLARVGVMIADAAAAERDRRSTSDPK